MCYAKAIALTKARIYAHTAHCDLGSTRTLVMLLRPWIRRFTMITVSLLGRFEQAANSVDKNSKKSTQTLDRRKFLSRCGFLQSRSWK